nr:response regulator [uncultured Methanoregula sp.]
MNGPPPNGNEGIVDIFVLSTSGTLAPMLKEHLEQNGYHVTLFQDGENLLETLKSGKPNLLICDTTDPELPSYDICRQIKTDRDLWVIPVLVLTGASEFSDLLFVLDSNADNFISLPYDRPYLLSLIGGMLDTPVERPTPEQIKTQFKIQHNDHIFVITADRRKLLEFLLSSFEIAVSRQEELSQTKDQIRSLDQSVEKLESDVGENKREIRTLNETLDLKEQDLNAFRVKIEENNRLIAGKTKEIDILKNDLEDTESLLADARDKLSTLTQERDAAAISHQAEIDILNEKIVNLSQELDALTVEHDEVKDSHQEISSRHALAEKGLAELQIQKDQADAALVTLKQEYDALNAACNAEKARALAAEEEIKTIVSSKAELEKDLNRIIEELNVVSKQKESDIAGYIEAISDAKAHSANLEVQITSLEKEKELTESALGMRIDDLQAQLADLQVRCSSATAEIEEKETALKSLDANFSAVNLEMEKTLENVRLLSAELEETRAALTDENCNRSAREDEIRNLTAEKERASEHALSLSRTLEEVQTSLIEVKERHRVSEAKLEDTIREQTATLQSLRNAHDDVKGDLDLHRNDLVQARHDLDLAVRARSDLETTLTAANAKIQSLEQEIQSVSANQNQVGQQVRSLGDELEQVRAALDTERRLHRVAEESLQSALAAHERSRQDLGRLVGERSSLDATLESERKFRQDAELAKETARKDLALASEKFEEIKEQLVSVGLKQTEQIRCLSEELESSRTRQKTLEDLVESLRNEKQIAENNVSSLSTEIEQARTALADEWEDHMNDHEQLIVAVEEKELSTPVQPLSGESETERIKKRAVIVKGPDLPMVVRPASLPMKVSPVPGPEMPRITGVEDLFEDDEPEEEARRGESAPISSPKPVGTTSPKFSPDSGISEPISRDEEPELPADEDQDAEFDESYEEGGEYNDELSEEIPDEPEAPSVQPGFSFNRAQWFDLLRWSHHSGALSQEQRMQIVRMGRLIQRGRRLTPKQEEQVLEMITLAQALGYRFTG